MITKADFKILSVGAKTEGAAFYGKGMTDMYGVNNSVNTSNVYNYGKNAKAQGPQEQQKSTPPKKAMRADEILFSEVYNADKSSVDALGLSDNAKNLLLELKEKYKGYDFMVGDYETDEQASRILNGGRGTLMNVLITPDLLEEMAADESVKAKYMGIIDEAAGKFNQAKEQLTEDGRSIVEKLGMTVGADGSVSFFAKLVDGVTADDGGSYIKCSIIEDFTKSLNTLAEARKKMSAEKEESNPVKLDTPEEKEEKVEKSVMPPKSYEKYRKEENPYSTEEDYGTMPPKSFEKYAKEENPYSTEEDYGTLPPESFKKYQDAASETDIPGDTMNYTV